MGTLDPLKEIKKESGFRSDSRSPRQATATSAGGHRCALWARPLVTSFSEMVTSSWSLSKRNKNSLPSVDMVVALVENSVTLNTGQEKKICIYMYNDVRF